MRYQKIYVQIWNDEKFIELSEPSKIFFLYLLTSPHSNLIGAFVIKKGYIAEDLKWSIPRVEKAIKELVKDDMIMFDSKVSVVAVSNYLKYNPLENPNQFTGAVKIYKSLPRTSILSNVFSTLETLSKRFNRAFEGASKPEAVTVTEPETGDEPEKEKDLKIYESFFSDFWELYPKRNGKKLGKITTKELFLKLDEKELPNIVVAATNYANSKAAKDGYAKDPERFFKKDFWLDWMEAETVQEERDEEITIGSKTFHLTASEFKRWDAGGRRVTEADIPIDAEGNLII